MRKTVCGTAAYLSPEMILGTGLLFLLNFIIFFYFIIYITITLYF